MSARGAGRILGDPFKPCRAPSVVVSLFLRGMTAAVGGRVIDGGSRESVSGTSGGNTGTGGIGIMARVIQMTISSLTQSRVSTTFTISTTSEACPTGASFACKLPSADPDVVGDQESEL